MKTKIPYLMKKIITLITLIIFACMQSGCLTVTNHYFERQDPAEKARCLQKMHHVNISQWYLDDLENPTKIMLHNENSYVIPLTEYAILYIPQDIYDPYLRTALNKKYKPMIPIQNPFSQAYGTLRITQNTTDSFVVGFPYGQFSIGSVLETAQVNKESWKLISNKPYRIQVEQYDTQTIKKILETMLLPVYFLSDIFIAGLFVPMLLINIVWLPSYQLFSLIKPELMSGENAYSTLLPLFSVGVLENFLTGVQSNITESIYACNGK
jgi:hypothetical protein